MADDNDASTSKREQVERLILDGVPDRPERLLVSQVLYTLASLRPGLQELILRGINIIWAENEVLAHLAASARDALSKDVSALKTLGLQGQVLAAQRRSAERGAAELQKKAAEAEKKAAELQKKAAEAEKKLKAKRAECERAASEVQATTDRLRELRAAHVQGQEELWLLERRLEEQGSAIVDTRAALGCLTAHAHRLELERASELRRVEDHVARAREARAERAAAEDECKKLLDVVTALRSAGSAAEARMREFDADISRKAATLAQLRVTLWNATCEAMRALPGVTPPQFQFQQQQFQQQQFQQQQTCRRQTCRGRRGRPAASAALEPLWENRPVHTQ